MNNTLICCRKLSKIYHDGVAPITVLSEINLEIKPSSRIAIIGPSGSGKSTLLHLLGGLDKPSSGEVLLQGQNWQTLSEKKRCLLRNKTLGFVYQFHHLLPEFSAIENVALPLIIGGHNTEQAMHQAQTMLTNVGLEHRITHKPSQLSGGERQRVAIARALVHQPQCLLADEPTGNLDQNTAQVVFDLMLELNQSRQTALVIVTHDPNIAMKMDQVLTLKEGRIETMTV